MGRVEPEGMPCEIRGVATMGETMSRAVGA
jgi:hypothetical protein